MRTVLLVLFAATQLLYIVPLLVTLQFYVRPIRWVDTSSAAEIRVNEAPKILLLYPVLREREGTMRTTMHAIADLAYPASHFQVVAIPNHDDHESITALNRLQDEFAFLQVLSVPATSDERWNAVWEAWDANPNAYWWHEGQTAAVRGLPPKKTRQLVYAMYRLAEVIGSEHRHEWLLDYIDADSAPPREHFLAAAAGSLDHGVLQSTNVAGNMLSSWAATFHAMDHVCWDGSLWPHTSSSERQPFWMLGKGLFYRLDDLVEAGSFNPWLTIEDPEVGMRLWANGVRMGVIAEPLIEEVPVTFGDGLTQRKRWVCGFLQSLGRPLRLMGMSWHERMRARLNFVPCASLPLNVVGLPLAIWGTVTYATGGSDLPAWIAAVSIGNLVMLTVVFALIMKAAWTRSRMVLETRRQRLWFMLRVNPVFLLGYWLYWTAPLAIGFEMFLRNKGLVWEPTRKVDANHELVRRQHEA